MTATNPRLDVARAVARAECAILSQQNLILRLQRNKLDSAPAEQLLMSLQRSLQQLAGSYRLLNRLADPG
jgi:hypothetical protein